ncbi:hypothetical protein B0H19DRAFT_1119419 [Mycena capillaripes]|nr:hypothetical protein B0H19DRAFT_1119419 [Mycena capillaripes]
MDSCPFPLEIVDLIIGQLHDLLALKSCAVVCRSWLPSCRSRLFRYLQLRPTGRNSSKSWNHFLSGAPHILSYIQELVVLCDRSSWVSWDPVLPALLGKLQNLEEIELHGCDLPCLPAPLSSAIYTLFRSPLMKRVSLRLCVLPSSCFHLFGPALQDIELSDITVEPDVSVPMERCRSARPKRLMIEGKAVNAVVNWLLPTSERNELEDLQDLCIKYQGDDPDALQAVERLLQSASRLRTLDICLYPAGPQFASALCAAPSICYNQELRELRLSHFDMDTSSPTNQLPWLGTLLSQMTTQHTVQKITIDARYRPCPRLPILDHLGWANVDDILARTAPPHLEDVLIRIGDAYSSSPAQISSNMPILSARGILRVTK